MKKIFSFLIGFTLFFYTLFTPVYFFLNSSVDTIEELTLKDFFIHSNLEMYPSSWKDQERKIKSFAKKTNIDINLKLLEALESKDHISNIKIEVVKSSQAVYSRPMVDREGNKLELVRVTFDSTVLKRTELAFLVKNKTFYPPSLSSVYGTLTGLSNEQIFELYLRE